MRTIHRDIVVAMIVSADGKLLLAQQADNPQRPYPGCWGLIGGGIEDGEDDTSALIREVREESGLDISNYRAELLYEDSDAREKTLKTGERVICKMTFRQYKVAMSDKNSGELAVKLDEEHSAFMWANISQLASLKLAHPSTILFGKLRYL